MSLITSHYEACLHLTVSTLLRQALLSGLTCELLAYASQGLGSSAYAAMAVLISLFIELLYGYISERRVQAREVAQWVKMLAAKLGDPSSTYPPSTTLRKNGELRVVLCALAATYTLWHVLQ